MFKTLAQIFSQVNQQAEKPVVNLELAMAVLLYEVAAADTEILPSEENAMLKLLAQSFQLNTQQSNELLVNAKSHQHNAVSLQEFTHILRQHLDREQRVNFLRELWQVANSDETIDQNEEHIIRRICDLLYLNHSDFIKAKLSVIK